MAQVQVIQPYQPQSEELEKVAAYCRVSTDSKDQLNSYRTQIGYYTNFIAQHPGWELVDINADEGITGTSLEKRDEFKRMLQDCRAGKIQRVLVKSVSRFARNTLELIETTRELKDLGVVVVFEEQGIDTAQMLGEMQLTLLAMAAQEESTSISKNMRWSIQKRMDAGTYLGNTSPYGYRLEDGQLKIEETEAAVVRRIFEMRLSGMGQVAITQELNRQGIHPRDGKPWTVYRVRYILSNERYIGDSLFQKKYIADPLSHKSVRNHGSATNTTFTTPTRQSSAGKTSKKYRSPFKTNRPAGPKLPTSLFIASYVPSAAATTGTSAVLENLTGDMPAKVKSNPRAKIFGFQRKAFKQRLSIYWESCTLTRMPSSPPPSPSWKRSPPGRSRATPSSTN